MTERLGSMVIQRAATKRNPTCRRRRVLNMHTGHMTTKNLGNSLGKCQHLHLEICAERYLAFEHGNENRQFIRADE